MHMAAIQPAFLDAPRETQTVFRAVMDAMARPGRIVALETRITPPAPLSATAAAILLTLADFETPIWLDTALARQPEVMQFLRFHTGAPIVEAPEAAAFALIADGRSAPALATFGQGTPDYPDGGATVIYQVDTVRTGAWRFSGPGIHGETVFGAAPLPQDFAVQLGGNRQRFPLGVDVIFAAPSDIAALPRSVRLIEAR